MSPTRIHAANLVEKSETGSAVRAFYATDWAKTSLGPQESWPQVLRTLVDLMLHASQPMFLVWGDARTTIYNDSYAEILDRKHPAAMGMPLDQVWHEIWDSDLKTIVEQAYDGRPVLMDDIKLVMHHRGYPEARHFAFSYTPVRDGAGDVMGFFCPCHETTDAVMAARRSRAAERLSEILRTKESPRDILREATAEIATHLDAALIAFCEFDRRDGTLRLREQKGVEGFPLLGPRLRPESLGEGVFARLEQGASVILDGRDRIAELGDYAHSAIRQAESVLVLPITSGGDLVGAAIALDRETRHWLANDVDLVRDFAERSWSPYKRAQVSEMTRHNEARFRNMTDALPQITWSAGADGRHDRFNARWYEFTGAEEQSFDPDEWADFLHPADRDNVLDTRRHALASGAGYEVEARLWREGDRYRSILIREVPVQNDGRVTQWIGSATDIHEIREVQKHRTLLASELNHRVKNALTVVQALAIQTFRGDKDRLEMISDFQARLSALAKTHDTLMRESWSSARLRDIVIDCITGSGASVDRLRVKGPDVIIPPRAAVTLALAIHELSTNAIKFGSLSGLAGTVDICWSVSPGRDGTSRLAIDWTENGGPATSPPDRAGFGTKMLEGALASEMNGTVDMIFDPDGFRCHIEGEIPGPEGST